ncbi:tyrosine-type recombinase/integrase [Roseobacter litoralis]|uniref:tyrosine-type recombinase/integrase n=1 Tax=Roseobacter litoralis TaxID=42443 RepID=UPI002490E793|nr:site-specific integrase [Roseobacter litoralis]
MTIKLKHIVQDKDRHGNVRVYFRKDGKKVRLSSVIGTAEFLAEYRLAMVGQHPKQRPSKEIRVADHGTLRELIEGYYGSAAYQGLSDRTRHVRRQILDRFCQYRNAGEQPYAALEARHLMAWRDTLISTPEAANSTIKGLRQVFKYAVKYSLHNHNPAALVENLPSNGDGHIAWTDEDVENFEAVHPVGSTARLALALALHTGQRKSDIIRLGRQHIQEHDGRKGLEFTQHKNRNRKPVRLWVPIAPELQKIIDASPTGDLTFIETAFGRPFSEGGFGNRFRKWCNEAGLEGLSIHGLRKTAAAVLAQNGCTEQEIMAITGHTTSKEVVRYTRSAKQKVRATNAMAKMHTKFPTEQE